MSYYNTNDIANHPDLSRYQTVDANASVVWLEKAQTGKVTLEHIGDALAEYSNLFKAGLASKAEILTLSRAYPQSTAYAEAAGDLYKSIDVDPIVIGGPASVELVDREGHLITTQALDKAFKKFMDNGRTRNVMVLHSDVQVGWALPAYISKGGQIFKSGVDDKGLFFICELRDDTAIAKKVADQINQGMLKSYSIAGSATKVQNMTKGETPYLQVDDMELAEVTVCEKGVNQGASFDILKAETPQTGKIDKDQCGYRDASMMENMQGINCGHCKYFNEDDKTCDTVSGDIQPKDYCKIFAPRKAGMENKIVMVQVHRNKDDGKVNFHKSFDAWLSKEKDPLTSGESFVTLNNEAARQEEHQLLLREYGFPLEMDVNAQRYVPVVEVETDEDGKPIHNLPPWVVNEAGEMLGDRLDEDAPTYKNSAKAKNRKKSGALQKLLINNYLSKLSRYESEKQDVLNRLSRGDTGVPGAAEQLYRRMQQGLGGRPFHPFSYFSDPDDHKRFLEELAEKHRQGELSPRLQDYAMHDNNRGHFEGTLAGEQHRKRTAADEFGQRVGEREQRQKQYPSVGGEDRELPFNPDEVDEMHRVLGIGDDRVFSHPNHYGMGYADQRAEMKYRHGQKTPDGMPKVYGKKELHEHLADINHLIKHKNGHTLAHMNVNLPEGANAFSMIDHHDVVGLIKHGFINFEPSTGLGEGAPSAARINRHINDIVELYKTPENFDHLENLGGSYSEDTGAGPEPSRGTSGGNGWSAGSDPDDVYRRITGRERLTGAKPHDIYDPNRPEAGATLNRRTPTGTSQDIDERPGASPTRMGRALGTGTNVPAAGRTGYVDFDRHNDPELGRAGVIPVGGREDRQAPTTPAYQGTVKQPFTSGQNFEWSNFFKPGEADRQRQMRQGTAGSQGTFNLSLDKMLFKAFRRTRYARK